MTKRTGALLFGLLAALFLVLNHQAYGGYFQADELDNLSWAPLSPVLKYLRVAISPFLHPDNFRPVGHFYFYAAGHLFGLAFAKYVLVLHALHLFNVWLVWRLLRRLETPPFPAAAACLFFALHMALFDAFWKPMYVFDVLCATFCLLSLLWYSRQRWLLSFISFWLAYKAKEVAVMLPVALACYEFWFGRRRWKPLVPFFAVSLSFGLQGVLLSPQHDNDYTFRFTPDALFKTASFYSGRVFLMPYLGLALPLAAWAARNRRAWFGLATMAALFIPMLFLPGRIFAAYCYVPFIGLAVVLSSVAERVHPAAVAAFLLLWAPLDVHELRAQRRATLAQDDQVREWVTTVAGYARTAPPPFAVVYSGRIPGFASWGVEGALHIVFQRLDLPIHANDEPEAAQLLEHGNVPLLVWNPGTRKLRIVQRQSRSSDAQFFDFDGTEPVQNLEAGWHESEGDYRWSTPHATIRIRRPEGAKRFILKATVPGEMLSAVGPVTVRVFLDGRELEAHKLCLAGRQTVEWKLAPAPAGPVLVTIDTHPPFKPPADSRTLGLAVHGLGFGL